MLAIYFWDWDLVLKVVCVPREDPQKRTDFSLCMWLSAGDSFWIWIGTGVQFPSQPWDPIWFTPVHGDLTQPL